MPELPEVETVRRGLEPALVGARIVRVEQRRPDLRFPLPDRFAERLVGRTVLSLSRRAKYLLAALEGGEVLMMHLGMSGRFCITHCGNSENAMQLVPLVHHAGVDQRHDHVVVHLLDGTAITYNDPRRFGFMLLVPGADLDTHPLLRGLGLEPLGDALSPEHLAAKAQGRKADLKAFLMDQRIVAGLGNIYVCEALFRARLSPFRAASCLSTRNDGPTERARRLVPAIRAVIEDAIAAGGSTLRDYRHADGKPGGFQDHFLVYGREGEPCARPSCKGIVRRSIQGGRSTFHCPGCQR